MATTFQNLLDRAEEAATNIAIDASVSPLIDSEVTAEVIYPHAVRSVFRDYAKTGRHLDDMQMDHSIDLNASGVGTLPDNVIRECLDHAYIPRDQFASKVPYEDYMRYRYDSQMCYFAVKGGSIYYSCASTLKSTGTWTFIRMPVEGETIVINGVTFTFRLPGVVVSAGGFSAGNGTYTKRGTSASHNYYTLVGQISSESYSAIYYYSNPALGYWWITDSGGTSHYRGQTDALTPDLVTEWTVEGGADVPAPTTPLTLRTFSSVEVEIADTIALTVANFVAALNASTNTSITPATYTVGTPTNTAIGTYDEVNAAGNSYTMAASSSGAVTVSGSVFAGGAALVVNTPGIPTAPTAGSDVLTFAPAIIDDIVMKIAGVLRGELKLNALIGGNDVRK